MNNYNDIEEKLIQKTIKNMKSSYYDTIINPYIKSEKIIDMHTHTNCSDGDMSPVDLIWLAIKNNVGVLAITDHDTIDGIKQIDRNSNIIKDSDIKIINGIELSASSSKGRMHILGYDIDLNNTALNNKMESLKDNSINSVLSVIEQIKKDYGIIFTYNEIKELVNSNHNLGRPDIAKLLIKNGYVNSVQEAFDKYLVRAYDKIKGHNKKMSYEECINLILKSDGIPVLAHPKTLELNEKDFLILIKKMIEVGLKGIEVYHSNHTKEETNLYLEIAKKYNLLISGGSDFHGKSVKPDIELGKGRNNNILIKKLSILDKIK